MNEEICKNCRKSCFFIYTNRMKKIIVASDISKSQIHSCNMVFYHNGDGGWNPVKGIGNYENYVPTEKNLMEIELDKDCPYYAEHQMTDWNKNES